MPYTIKESRTYPQSKDTVLQAILGAVAGLEGKVLEQGDDEVVAWFNKTILGKVLGDRSRLEIALQPAGDGGTTVTITAYPVDVVGRKLMFGARKGVIARVLGWFWAHLEHRLPANGAPSAGA